MGGWGLGVSVENALPRHGLVPGTSHPWGSFPEVYFPPPKTMPFSRLVLYGWMNPKMGGSNEWLGGKAILVSLQSQYPVSLRTRDAVGGENKVNFMIGSV